MVLVLNIMCHEALLSYGCDVQRVVHDGGQVLLLSSLREDRGQQTKALAYREMWTEGRSRTTQHTVTFRCFVLAIAKQGVCQGS